MANLRSLVAEELSLPVDRQVSAMAGRIAAKHGAASRAVLFYGSCLREQQLDGLMLDFYRCYRAYVRGKVESFKLDEPGFTIPEYAAAQERAGRYFALAQRYASRLAGAPGK